MLWKQTVKLISIVCLIGSMNTLVAQNETDIEEEYITVSGIVKDQTTKQQPPY